MAYYLGPLANYMTPKPMVQWEYKRISRNDDWEFLETLNSLGREGWELASVIIDGTRHTAYLKKQSNL